MPQLDLFQRPLLPAGFRYQPDVLSADEERELIDRFSDLPFTAFQFQGFEGKRRVVSFGWRFDFAGNRLERAPDIPPFLLPIRDRAAHWAGLDPADFQHVLITEYGPGAAIGWHRDRPVFADVIGVSLGARCVFRLRRRSGTRWERVSMTAEPRSAYLLQGLARTEWEHSIPAVDELRYSITFRSLRG
jgi:alkylated DNA repair dioxygenase AlkB